MAHFGRLRGQFLLLLSRIMAHSLKGDWRGIIVVGLLILSSSSSSSQYTYKDKIAGYVNDSPKKDEAAKMTGINASATVHPLRDRHQLSRLSPLPLPSSRVKWERDCDTSKYWYARAATDGR